MQVLICFLCDKLLFLIFSAKLHSLLLDLICFLCYQILSTYLTLLDINVCIVESATMLILSTNLFSKMNDRTSQEYLVFKEREWALLVSITSDINIGTEGSQLGIVEVKIYSRTMLIYSIYKCHRGYFISLFKTIQICHCVIFVRSILQSRK